MLNFSRIIIAGLLIATTSTSYGQSTQTGPFHKVTISPYIEATFIQGDQENVVINHMTVDSNKLKIETKNGVLRIYLEGAKEIPHNTRDNNRNSDHIYPDHSVTATIYYKKLDELSLRGSEHFNFTSPLSAEHFSLTLYGESIISFTEVNINDLHTVIYGESSVEVQSGSINKQFYTCYGEGKVNTTGVRGEEAKLTAYGEAEFNMNISGRIKITSFGEAKLRYKGNAQIVKGLNVGGVNIAKMD